MMISFKKLMFSRNINRFIIPTLFVLLGGVSFGSIFAANIFALESGLPYFSYVFWQIFLGAIILIIISFVMRCVPKFSWANIKVFVFFATLGLITPVVVFNIIADKLPPGVITLSVALIPASTYILALLIREDSFRLVSILGVVIGFGSVLLIVIPGNSLPISGAEIWVLFSLIVPISCGANNAFSVLIRPPDAQTIGLAAGTMLMASLILFPVSLVQDGIQFFGNYGWKAIGSTLWASIVWIMVYICFFEIVKRTSGLFYSQVNYVIVAAGLIWSWIIFSETLSIWVWAAVTALFISLALINSGSRHEKKSCK